MTDEHPPLIGKVELRDPHFDPHDTDEGSDLHTALKAQNTMLKAAIASALAPLGTGNCKNNTCESCRTETQMAIDILNIALAKAVEMSGEVSL